MRASIAALAVLAILPAPLAAQEPATQSPDDDWSGQVTIYGWGAGIALAPEDTFVDPVTAIRFNSQIAPRLSLLAYGDVGGFGVGSDLTWQGVATLNYRTGKSLYLSAGYRHLYLDRPSGGTRFEGYLSGPLAGATLTF